MFNHKEKEFLKGYVAYFTFFAGCILTVSFFGSSGISEYIAGNGLLTLVLSSIPLSTGLRLPKSMIIGLVLIVPVVALQTYIGYVIKGFSPFNIAYFQLIASCFFYGAVDFFGWRLARKIHPEFKVFSRGFSFDPIAIGREKPRK